MQIKFIITQKRHSPTYAGNAQCFKKQSETHRQTDTDAVLTASVIRLEVVVIHIEIQICNQGFVQPYLGLIEVLARDVGCVRIKPEHRRCAESKTRKDIVPVFLLLYRLRRSVQVLRNPTSFH